VIPGSPELEPVKVESVKTLGGDVSKGSIGSKFVAKYILRMGHIRDRGLNSVVSLRKFTVPPLVKEVDLFPKLLTTFIW
jgi:hypothetical protein